MSTKKPWYFYPVKGLAKIIGRFWWRVAIRYQAKAFNIVANYKLQNKLDRLRRLDDSNPYLVQEYAWAGNINKGWSLTNPGHPGTHGFIKYTEVTKWQFRWWFVTVFMWLDPDANQAYFDAGYCNSITAGPGSWLNENADRRSAWDRFLLSPKLWFYLYVLRKPMPIPVYQKGDIAQYADYYSVGDFQKYLIKYTNKEDYWSAQAWFNRNAANGFDHWYGG